MTRHAEEASAPAATSGERPTLWALAWYWGVVIMWVAVISMFSSAPFSAANTNRYLDPMLRYLFPSLTPGGFVVAHTIIRKSAHFLEFFVLGCLVYWACRRGREQRWSAAWMYQALALGLVYAVFDEAHQAFVPSRTASLTDSGVDSLGAIASQVVIYVRHVLFAPKNCRS